MRFITRPITALFIPAAALMLAGCSAPATDAQAHAMEASSAPPASQPAGGSPGSSSQGNYEGFLEQMSCDTLKGWAWDRSQPDRATTIELYDGDRLVKTVVADQFRQDLLDAHKGNGRHLFVDAPPAELKDGKPHSIRAVVKGSGYTLRPLSNTPASMTCSR